MFICGPRSKTSHDSYYMKYASVLTFDSVVTSREERAGRYCRIMTDQEDEGILENVPEGSTVSLNPAARKRKEYEARRGKSRVNLYEQFVPWAELKSELNFDTHEQLAEFLINFYSSGRNAAKWYVKSSGAFYYAVYALAAMTIFCFIFLHI